MSGRKLFSGLAAAVAVFSISTSAAVAETGSLSMLGASAPPCYFATTGAGATNPGCGVSTGFVDELDAIASNPDGANVYTGDLGHGLIATFARSGSSGGALSQSSCLAFNAVGPCSVSDGVSAPRALAVSPDGKNVYAALGSAPVGAGEGAVSAFTRGSNGALSLISCYGISSSSPARPCADSPHAVGMGGANSVVVSSKYVFTGADEADAVSVFARSATGSLTQVACVADAVAGDPACTPINYLGGVSDVALSSDGGTLAVSSRTSASVSLFRVSNAGALTRVSCLGVVGLPPDCAAAGIGLDSPSDVAISPDGGTVYVASNTNSSLTTLSVAADGSLGFVSTIDVGPITDVVASPDGNSVYVTASSGENQGTLRAFRRGTGGALTSIGCISTGEAGCSTAAYLRSVAAAAVTADGRSVNTIGAFPNVDAGFGILAAFGREPAPDPIVPCANPVDPGCTPVVATTPTTTTTTTTTPPPPAKPCAYFEKGAKVAHKAVSNWKNFPDTTRIRLVTQSGGSILRAGKDATFTLQARGIGGRRSTVRGVKFSIDGKTVGNRSGAPFTLTIDPKKYAVGDHKLVATAYTKSGKRLTVSITFAARDCRLPAILASMSSKLRRAHPNMLLKAYSGGPELATVNFGLPKFVRATVTRKLLGKPIGGLKITDANGKETNSVLRFGRSLATSMVLYDKGGLKVVFRWKGANPGVDVTGLPENVNGVSVSLKGTKTRMFRNVDSCQKLSYSGKMIARNGSSTTQRRFTALCSTLR